MNKEKIRVAIADDQRILREGLRIILETTPDMVVVGEAEDGVACVKLAFRTQPDIMLIDIRMPGLEGIGAAEMIHKAHPAIRLMLLTTYDSPELLVEGFRVGVSGYLLKDCTAEELCSAIRAVMRNQVTLHAGSAAKLLAGLPPASISQTPSAAEKVGLTVREQEVLHLIVRGLNNREIASRLNVSEPTVKTHIHHLFSKLGARDRIHAVILAHQLNFAL